MSTNYIDQRREINSEFASLMQSLYMKGEWQVQSGIKVLPAWYVTMRKSLLDWQTLASVDCDNEYKTASQGHVSYDCCPTGSTLTSPVVYKCCPDGTSYRNSSNQCEDRRVRPYIYTDPIACPCCPDGYTWIASTKVCLGANASDIKAPIDCIDVCIDGVGNKVAKVACPDLVPGSILLSGPAYGATGEPECETTVTSWTAGCCNWNGWWGWGNNGWVPNMWWSC